MNMILAAAIALTLSCSATAPDFPLHFLGATASDTNPGSFDAEYAANNALTSGPEYWCSNAQPTADAVWTAWFNEPNEIQAIHIVWAYAPKEVKIVASNDRINFRTVRDWHASSSALTAYEETLQFPLPTVVQELRILMRGPLHGYYGITSALPISSGLPTFMIISGVTTKTDAEYCLMAKTLRRGSSVIVDLCSAALSHADGRDLWQLNPSNQLIAAYTYPPLCLDQNLILGSCDVVRSVDFVANSQINLLWAGSEKCLTFEGESVGMEDIMISMNPLSEASSVLSIDHSAASGISQDTRFYWSSAAFDSPAERQVTFDIDFTSAVNISRVIIDWEYPPLSYSLALSDDGVEFANVAESLANPLNITRDDIGIAEGASSGRVLRISMHRLHPELGKVRQNAWVYGIRNVQALRNRVSLSIVECKIASQTKDSRDKWFRVPVHYFDTSVAELAQRARDILKSNLLSVESSAGRIESDLSGISQCRDDFKSMDLSLDSLLLQTMPSLSKRLRDLDDHKSWHRTTIHPGRSIDNPARSCRSAMGREMEKGFYWIDSVCQSDVLRMWCDGPSSGYYVYNDSSTLSDRRYQQNVLGVEFLCGSVGLYPLTVKSSHQIRSLMTMLSQQDVEIPESSAIPLAFDISEDGRSRIKSFRELGSMTDVTGIVQRFITGDSASFGNGVGFTSTNSVSEIDWRGGRLAGLICSAKPSEHEFVAKLDCNSVVSGNKIFQGGLNTNFRVGCPSDCPTSLTIYGGFEFVYSDNSSLCQAAIHSGLDSREFNVILETVHESYPSLFRNGIQSSPLSNVKSLYAVRLGPPFHGCPFDEMSLPSLAAGVLEPNEFVSSSNLTSAFAKLKMGGNLHSDKSTSFAAPINDLTHAVTNATLQDTRYSIPIDKPALDALRSNLMKVLSNGRSLIKPIESLSNKVNAESVNLFSKTNRFGDKVSAAVSESLTEVEDVTRRSEQFERRSIFLTGFEDWDASKFGDTREVSTMFDLWNKGSSSWDLVSNSESRVVLTQTGRVVATIPEEPFTSPVLALKSKRFYDFRYHVHVMIEQENNIGGILFRVQNSYNFYMLTVKKRNQSEFEFQLFRVEYGMIFPLMNGGLIIPINENWIDVGIECRRGKITIIVENIYTVFSAIDEFLVSGTVGFTVLQATGLIAYDLKSVKALCCENCQANRNEGPLPPECSYYEDPQYQGAFKKSFHTVTQTSGALENREVYDIENWDYTRSVVGRLQAIATSNVPMNLINMAILNRGFCSDGIISFDFSAKNCDNDGRLGIVYQYHDSGNFNWVTLGLAGSSIWKRNAGSELQMVATENSVKFVDDGSWHNLEIRFNDHNTDVLFDKNHVYSATNRLTSGGSAGIASSGCGFVAIDRFKLQPKSLGEHYEEKTCENAADVTERKQVCDTMLSHLKVGNCLSDFCKECCNMRHAFQPHIVGDCTDHCRLNDQGARRHGGAK